MLKERLRRGRDAVQCSAGNGNVDCVSGRTGERRRVFGPVLLQHFPSEEAKATVAVHQDVCETVLPQRNNLCEGRWKSGRKNKQTRQRPEKKERNVVSIFSVDRIRPSASHNVFLATRYIPSQ